MTDLLARMSSHELVEWQAYFWIEAEEQKREVMMARAKAATPRRK